MKYQAQRGTHDILPSKDAEYNSDCWRDIVESFFAYSSQYGYGEIQTPAFEDVDLFVRSSGDTSEVVTKQMYQFSDMGERQLALKPEGTAPALRAAIENRLVQQHLITRLSYFTQVFRYERPQKGRYRQSHQFGLELIGSGSAWADVEIIEFSSNFYQKMGIDEVTVLVNSIGREQTREKYREAILKHFNSWLSDLETGQRELALKNPLRLLDSKNPAMTDLIKSAPSIQDYLEPESKQHFEEVLSGLEEFEVAYEVRPEIVRGLDYYTDTVFEVHSSMLGSQGALCGGGRYDNLIGELGGPNLPAVGVGMGVERLYMVLRELDALSTPQPIDLFFVAATESAQKLARNWCHEARERGLAAQVDIDQGSMKSQLKQADKFGATVAVIIGDDEIAKGTFTVKILVTGEQRTIKQDELWDFSLE